MGYPTREEMRQEEDYYKLLAQRGQQSQQIQIGSLGGGLTGALQGWGFVGTTAQIPAYDKIYPSMLFKQPGCSRMFSFFRINQKADIAEIDVVKKRFIEPLDELRLKVSKWLYN